MADHVTVHARLERVTARLTRVGLRVEAGRLVADRDTGTQTHDQIAALLAPVTAPPPAADPAAAEALTSLHGRFEGGARTSSSAELRSARPREAKTARACAWNRVPSYRPDVGGAAHGGRSGATGVGGSAGDGQPCAAGGPVGLVTA